MDQYIRSQLLSAVNNRDNEKLEATYERIKSEGMSCNVSCISYNISVKNPQGKGLEAAPHSQMLSI